MGLDLSLTREEELAVAKARDIGLSEEMIAALFILHHVKEDIYFIYNELERIRSSISTIESEVCSISGAMP